MNKKFGKYPVAVVITHIIRLTVFVLALLFTSSIVTRAQQAGNPDLPVPEIKVDSFVVPNQDLNEGVFTIISWTVNTDDQLGYKLEIQEQGTDKKYTAALFAPDAPGVDTTTTGGVYKTDVFQPNKKYDIWVTSYARDGKESVPGTFTLDTAPRQAQNCAETFGTITKQRNGDLVLFDWNDICKSSKTATSYKIYKNGQLFGEVDDSDSFYATSSNPPEGTVWKIEAYGEEPPSTNMDVIKNCDTTVNGEPYSEIVTKMARRSVMVPVVRVYNGRCQIVGTWLRAIVEFQPYSNTNSVDCASPRAWLGCALMGYNTGGKPYFNFVAGSFPVPGYPGRNYFNGFVMCGSEGQTVNNSSGAVTDPWNQLPDWRCNSSYTYGTNYSVSYTDRAWVNLDLNAAGGPSVWPVITEFPF